MQTSKAVFSCKEKQLFYYSMNFLSMMLALLLIAFQWKQLGVYV